MNSNQEEEEIQRNLLTEHLLVPMPKLLLYISDDRIGDCIGGRVHCVIENPALSIRYVVHGACIFTQYKLVQAGMAHRSILPVSVAWCTSTSFG